MTLKESSCRLFSTTIIDCRMQRDTSSGLNQAHESQTNLYERSFLFRISSVARMVGRAGAKNTARLTYPEYMTRRSQNIMAENKM